MDGEGMRTVREECEWATSATLKDVTLMEHIMCTMALFSNVE